MEDEAIISEIGFTGLLLVGERLAQLTARRECRAGQCTISGIRRATVSQRKRQAGTQSWNTVGESAQIQTKILKTKVGTKICHACALADTNLTDAGSLGACFKYAMNTWQVKRGALIRSTMADLTSRSQPMRGRNQTSRSHTRVAADTD